MSSSRALVAPLAMAAIAALVGACKGDTTHIFSARRFDPARACLDPYTAVDVVSGDDTGGSCALVCIFGASEYYVTRQCAPYPPLFGVSSSDAGGIDPVCASAFAAYARGDTCNGDAGVIHGDGGVANDAGDASDASDASDANGANDAPSD